MPKPKITEETKFHHTKHAKQRQGERCIDAATMEAIVRKPRLYKYCSPGTQGGQRFFFKENIDGRTVVVLAEVKDDDCWLITGYYED